MNDYRNAMGEATVVILFVALLMPTACLPCAAAQDAVAIAMDSDHILAVALSPDGASLISSDGHCVKVCDANTGFVREVLMTYTYKPIPREGK